MDPRIIPIVDQMEVIDLSRDEKNYSSDDLVIDCPELRFDARNKTKKYIWHDLQKLAAHVGSKNSLVYAIADVEPLIEAEMKFLLKVRLDLIKILCCVKAERNKKLILSILEYIYNRSFATGGGTSCVVRRIIVIFEKLGGVKASNKRKTDQSDDQTEFLEEDAGFESASEEKIALIEPPVESPVKRRKTLSVPAAAVPVEVELTEAPRAGWMHKLDLSTERQVHAINQEELGLPVPEDVQQQLDRIEMETLLEFHIDLDM